MSCGCCGEGVLWRAGPVEEMARGCPPVVSFDEQRVRVRVYHVFSVERFRGFSNRAPLKIERTAMPAVDHDLVQMTVDE